MKDGDLDELFPTEDEIEVEEETTEPDEMQVALMEQLFPGDAEKQTALFDLIQSCKY